MFLELLLVHLRRLERVDNLLDLLQGFGLGLVPGPGAFLVRFEQVREFLVRVEIAEGFLGGGGTRRSGFAGDDERGGCGREFGGAEGGGFHLDDAEVFLGHAVALEVARDGDFGAEEGDFFARGVQASRVAVGEGVVLAVGVVQLEDEVEGAAAGALRGLDVDVAAVVHEGGVALEGLELGLGGGVGLGLALGVARVVVVGHDAVVLHLISLVVRGVHLVVRGDRALVGTLLRLGLLRQGRLALGEGERVVVGGDRVAGVLGQTDGGNHLGGEGRGRVVGRRRRRGELRRRGDLGVGHLGVRAHRARASRRPGGSLRGGETTRRGRGTHASGARNPD